MADDRIKVGDRFWDYASVKKVIRETIPPEYETEPYSSGEEFRYKKYGEFNISGGRYFIGHSIHVSNNGCHSWYSDEYKPDVPRSQNAPARYEDCEGNVDFTVIRKYSIGLKGPEHIQVAVDKNNNGIVDEGEIVNCNSDDEIYKIDKLFPKGV